MPRFLIPAAALALAAACSVAPSRRPAVPPALAPLHGLVARDFSGDSALRTVAFVEQFWRQPGSPGFDTSIARVAGILQRAGYVPEEGAPPDAPLVYRIERRPLERPAWTPLDASLAIEGGPELLRFSSNRNMLAIGSYSTPDTGVVAEVVDLSAATAGDIERLGVAGKIVYAKGQGRPLVAQAMRAGAVGALTYGLPDYLKPEVNRTSIQFGGFAGDSVRRTWSILLSFAAREALESALARGPVRVRAKSSVAWRLADELTLVAEARGAVRPAERFVFSAHVQEPGANDNASGVATQAEMARVLAGLVRRGDARPARTITFLWGDEITSTRRFLADDTARTAGVLWGMSLDMVGEDTGKTGGTFLIEKMPDPSAIWTRGEDRHTEWGGEPLTAAQMTPHYFNDFVLNRCREVARAVPGGWVVNTNPFEGGSDHTPFLSAGKPGLLLWHFTDQFYHTDNDRLDKVSAAEMRNVGRCALVTALALASADAAAGEQVVAELRAAALDRLAREFALSRDSIAAGGDRREQRQIIETWATWYEGAIRSAAALPVCSALDPARIEPAVAYVRAAAEAHLAGL